MILTVTGVTLRAAAEAAAELMLRWDDERESGKFVGFVVGDGLGKDETAAKRYESDSNGCSKSPAFIPKKRQS